MLLGDSKENIHRLLNELDKVCERRKLKVNVSKSKVMVCGKSQRGEQLNWRVRSLGINVKRMILFESIVVPNVLYRAEASGLNVRKKRRLNVIEMKE